MEDIVTLENLLWAGVVVLGAFVAKSLFFEKPKPKPVYEATPKMEVKQQGPIYITTAELASYDGSTPEKPLCFAVKGKIYDVTKGASFYGKGGPYGVFAGREAARGLATMSTDPKVAANPSISDLGFSDIQTLEDWISKFDSKYPVIGYITDGPYAHTPGSEKKEN